MEIYADEEGHTEGPPADDGRGEHDERNESAALASEVPAGTAEPIADELAALRAEVAALRVLTEEMRTDFVEKIRYDEVRERQITALHSEVQEHRRGFHRQLLRPVIDDLIRMHDDLVDALRAGIAARPDVVEQTLVSFLDSVLETLSRCGVERHEADADDDGVVDRARHKVLRSVPTDNPALDRRVARRRKAGFDYDGRVLRPEWVEAYRYTASADLAAQAKTAKPAPPPRTGARTVTPRPGPPA